MAQIIPLTDGAGRPGIRLTPGDRIRLFHWEAEQEAGTLGRVSLNEDVPCEGDERIDFVLIGRPGQCWADWGVARGPEGVMLWSCGNGTQLGIFTRMEDALAAVTRQLGAATAHNTLGTARPERRLGAMREAALARTTLAAGGDAAARLDRGCRILAFPAPAARRGRAEPEST